MAAFPTLWRRKWSLVILAIGLFDGTFWLLTSYLRLLDGKAAGWTALSGLTPGAGIILLVLLARRNPLPYGTGLVSLGLLPFLFIRFYSFFWLQLAFGIPLILVGAAFIVWRRHFESE